MEGGVEVAKCNPLKAVKEWRLLESRSSDEGLVQWLNRQQDVD